MSYRHAEYAILDFDDHIRDSHAAHLIRIGGKTHWLPKSVCRDFDAEAKTVEVQEWFLEKEELV